MTRVVGQVVRSLTVDLYEDITGPDVAVRRGRDFEGLEFDADLTDEQVDAIRDRMSSRDDVDQARRSELRALVDAAETGDLEDIRALSVAAMRYWLGE